MSKLKSHLSLHQILAIFHVLFGQIVFFIQFFHTNLVMLYIFEKVLHRQICWYQNVWGLYRKPKQNNFANTVGIKCLSNHTPYHNTKGMTWNNVIYF